LIYKKEKISIIVVLQEDTINLVELSGLLPENKGLAVKPLN